MIDIVVDKKNENETIAVIENGKIVELYESND